MEWITSVCRRRMASLRVTVACNADTVGMDVVEGGGAGGDSTEYTSTATPEYLMELSLKHVFPKQENVFKVGSDSSTVTLGSDDRSNRKP